MDASKDGRIDAPPPVLSRAFQELSRGMVNLMNVKKIREIPFPFPYAQLIQVSMMIHTAITPWIASYHCESPVWAAIICLVATCALWSVIYIAREIEHPFGDDSNDFDLP